jgi:hypothetical protein
VNQGTFYTPRTIAFLCDLFHPPGEPDPAAIQKVHNRMFQTGDPAYTCFAVAPNGAVLSNPVSRPGAASTVAFLADRYQFREELTSVTFESFAERVRRISEEVSQLTSQRVFTAQQVTIRTLVNPRSYKDSRAYLKQGMFGFRDEVDSFAREPQLYGIRLVFPPRDEQPNAFSLRIESFNTDPRSLYIENQGSFGPLMVARGLEPVEQNVLATYGFVIEQALPFIGRFDAPQPAE